MTRLLTPIILAAHAAAYHFHMIGNMTSNPRCLSEQVATRVPILFEIAGYTTSNAEVTVNVHVTTGIIREFTLSRDIEKVEYVPDEVSTVSVCFLLHSSADHSDVRSPAYRASIDLNMYSGADVELRSRADVFERLRPLEVVTRMTEDDLIAVHRELSTQIAREQMTRIANTRLATRVVWVECGLGVIVVILMIWKSFKLKRLVTRMLR